MGFQYRDDGVVPRRNLEKRLALYGLKLHPEKSRLIEFGRFAQRTCEARGAGKPESFNFLAAPWLLDGDRLLWVSRPMVVSDDSGELIELPARLIAVGLGDSAEIWTVALRDPVFRGSLPP